MAQEQSQASLPVLVLPAELRLAASRVHGPEYGAWTMSML
jgi:hypothetical protein